MAERKDVLLIYNEQDPVVQEIVDELDNLGYTSFFWRRDVPINTNVDGEEVAHMELTDNVMVLLGSNGWGQSHKRLTQEAMERQKNIIPVLTGPATEDALSEFDNYFKDKRYVDMTVRTPQAFRQLREALGPPGLKGQQLRYDELLSTLRDGNQSDRGRVIAHVRSSKSINRPALAARLRKAIELYDARSAANFPEAPRGAPQIESARSWLLSALIWTEPEALANKQMILDHLTLSVEPSETIRYWVLGGIFYRRVSYVQEALQISLEDESELIRLMARMIQKPNDEMTILGVKDELISDQADSRWRALRALRVIPLPAVVKEICSVITDFETSNITYDAFYALSHDVVAREAVPLLIERIGLAGLLEKIITITRNSESNALENFSHLLQYVAPEALETVLITAAQDPDAAGEVPKIRRFLSALRQKDRNQELYLAGFAADTIDVRQDLLDIQQDVKTLAAIMIARDVPPPLAIGLFGDWGTGKSFFMQSLKKEINEIRDKITNPEKTPFRTDIVQIEFNAWHYVDTSLWASLVTKIFDDLDVHVSPPATLQSKEQLILEQLTANQQKEQTEQLKKEQASAEIAGKQALLTQLQAERETRKISWKELDEQDFNRIIAPEQREELKKSLTAIGYDDLIKTGKDLNAVVTEAATVKSRVAALFAGILNSANRWLILTLLGMVLILFPLIGWAIHRYLQWDNILVAVNAFIAELVTVVGGAMVIMKKGLAKTKAALQVVLDTKGRIDQQLEAKRKAPTSAETDLEAEIASLKTALTSSEIALDQAQTEAARLNGEMSALHEEYSLNRFLSDIKKNGVYNSHLGLISQIRKHFDLLEDRLQNIPKGGKKVDRIVLYIDDLDRCPVDKVFEVLQAVHLMLAYPLFVVVVGVDPRWLLSSLKNNYSVFGQDAQLPDTEDNWRPTPQNFLEKIFQIPFCLRPMSSQGFGNLMVNLLHAESDEQAFESGRTAPGPETPPIANDPVTPAARNEASAIPGMQPLPAAPVPGTRHAEGFTINEQSLSIRSWEAAFAAELYHLIPTPRSAKRFTNIYRIIKASVQSNELAAYEGTPELRGEYALTMTLLALLTGQPKYAVLIFKALYAQAKKRKGIKEAINELAIDHQVPDELLNNITSIITTSGFPDTPANILKWLPLVSRFSFDLGKLFIKEELEQL